MTVKGRHKPVTESETYRLFQSLTGARGVGLAVSGGADSVALMRLFAKWRVRNRPDLPAIVLTVDHRLRTEAAQEAQQVGKWAATLGLEHETLVWESAKPKTGIQEAARLARYRLLSQRCVELGLSHLVTAHHLDDQAETILMRLARGSGVDGLAGMAAEVRRGGIILVRPLLDIEKARLVATLDAESQDWFEDPSNDDARFARSRWRNLMPELAKEGLTPRRLAELARRAARARAALDADAALLYAQAVVEDPAGLCRLAVEDLCDAPEEIALRVLASALAAAGGGERPPRMARLERLHEALKRHFAGDAFPGATLAGSRIVAREGKVLCYREAGRMDVRPVPVRRDEPVIWDGRFRISVATRHDLVVRALGTSGVAQLREKSPLRRVPLAAARASPGLFIGTELYAAPQLEAEPGAFSPAGVEIAFLGRARFLAEWS